VTQRTTVSAAAVAKMTAVTAVTATLTVTLPPVPLQASPGGSVHPPAHPPQKQKKAPTSYMKVLERSTSKHYQLLQVLLLLLLVLLVLLVVLLVEAVGTEGKEGDCSENGMQARHRWPRHLPRHLPRFHRQQLLVAIAASRHLRSSSSSQSGRCGLCVT
jgi:hypothetical protein